MLELALAAILTSTFGHVVPHITEDRRQDVAQDIINVVTDDMKNGVLRSKIDFNDAVMMLTAAVTIESGLRESVEDCKSTGDGGKSVGLGQVMKGPNWEGHTRSEICSSRKLQLQLSLHVIDRCWERTPNGAAAFRCYTSGDAATHSRVARIEYNLYSKIKKDLKKASSLFFNKPKIGSTSAFLSQECL